MFFDFQRRRKQLRLAQQAYRKRKETTIDNLQNRVHELETGIEDISHSFLSFSSLLIEEQLVSRYPHIASALQTLTQQCVSLAKSASEEAPVEGAIVKTAAKAEIAENHIIPESVLDKTCLETSPDIEDIIRSAGTKWPGAFPSPPTSQQDYSSLPFNVVMPSHTVHTPYLTPPLSESPPALNTLSSNTTPERQWNIAQRLVRTCCHNGYRLLVDSPNHSKIQRIFGFMLSLADRNRAISAFHAVLQDKTGVLTDIKANVLHALRYNTNILSDEPRQVSSRTKQIALESASGEWMDANGVQRYLYDKRIIFENYSDSSGRSDYPLSSSIDTTAFIRCEFLRHRNISMKPTNTYQALSTEAVCVGNGPSFPRQSVEKALRLATINVPWDFDDLM